MLGFCHVSSNLISLNNFRVQETIPIFKRERDLHNMTCIFLWTFSRARYTQNVLSCGLNDNIKNSSRHESYKMI